MAGSGRGAGGHGFLPRGPGGPTTPFVETYKAECVHDGKAVLGEGPVWNETLSSLDWVDIERGMICRFDPARGENREWDLGSRVGFAVPTRAGDVVAGTQQGLVRFDHETGGITPYLDPESHLPDNRFNDGKCDRLGRLWAGTMSLHETGGAGSLYRVESDATFERVVEGVTISNGLAWSADMDRMYYIDSPTRRVDLFDIEGGTGSLSGRRPLVALEEGMGYPDGMTIDAEGRLWVALWEGWGVVRIDPDSGEILARVEVPVARVTSCCFGGEDLGDLYITTASRDLTEEERERQSQAGGLFVARTGAGGLACDRFRG